MLPIKEIEKFVKKETKEPESITHGFGHLKRTAEGAKWFAKIHNENNENRGLAYLAGLLHDIVRPPSHNIEHHNTAAEKTRNVLKSFGVNDNDVSIIFIAINKHRGTKQKSNIEKYLFLADKIFDMMGAFGVFRRCTYVGESYDYKGVAFKEAIIKQFKRKMKEYNPGKFRQFKKLVNYQFSWVKKYFAALKRNEEWAVEIAQYCYQKGKEHKLSLEEIIKLFKPTKNKSRIYKKEALDYVNGKKFKEFEKLIK